MDKPTIFEKIRNGKWNCVYCRHRNLINDCWSELLPKRIIHSIPDDIIIYFQHHHSTTFSMLWGNFVFAPVLHALILAGCRMAFFIQELYPVNLIFWTQDESIVTTTIALTLNHNLDAQRCVRIHPDCIRCLSIAWIVSRNTTVFKGMPMIFGLTRSFMNLFYYNHIKRNPQHFSVSPRDHQAFWACPCYGKV